MTRLRKAGGAAMVVGVAVLIVGVAPAGAHHRADHEGGPPLATETPTAPPTTEPTDAPTTEPSPGPGTGVPPTYQLLETTRQLAYSVIMRVRGYTCWVSRGQYLLCF